MRYFDIKLRLKNDKNQLTCCYLTSANSEQELLSKKMSCIEKETRIDDYYDETEEINLEQAIERATSYFKWVITRKYKEEHLGLNERPIKEELNLLKRDLTKEEYFDALRENSARLLTVDTLIKNYDISKISAKKFFEIVDELINSKNEEENKKILSKLKIKKWGKNGKDCIYKSTYEKEITCIKI